MRFGHVSSGGEALGHDLHSTDRQFLLGGVVDLFRLRLSRRVWRSEVIPAMVSNQGVSSAGDLPVRKPLGSHSTVVIVT